MKKLMAMVMMMSALVFFCGCGEKEAMSRTNFTDAVMGQTKAQVVGSFGKPSRTSGSPELELWTYENKTKDSVTGKVGNASVYFSKGVVVKVLYF